MTNPACPTAVFRRRALRPGSARHDAAERAARDSVSNGCFGPRPTRFLVPLWPGLPSLGFFEEAAEDSWHLRRRIELPGEGLGHRRAATGGVCRPSRAADSPRPLDRTGRKRLRSHDFSRPNADLRARRVRLAVRRSLGGTWSAFSLSEHYSIQMPRATIGALAQVHRRDEAPWIGRFVDARWGFDATWSISRDLELPCPTRRIAWHQNPSGSRRT